MHGLLHKSLKGYVGEYIDEITWNEVLAAADIEPKLYLPVSRYPDEEFTDAIVAVAEATDRDEDAIQREVGEYLAPELLKTFKAHVKSGWETREVIFTLENIYAQIRKQDGESALPTVATDRIDADTYVVNYRSGRGLCALGEGIILSIADEFDDEVALSHDVCIHDGGDHCELTVEFA
ncbi:heme NO-binding domain-containing protein [Haloarchaeobius sp. DFWS5]|uniref:heme NO-binding domain-containing protein n=1 Tax=Haloarchaeobius sp. DFWS5 TaxID=3446114 RepID=UPI003EC11553